jgi:hypothetical protein
VVSKRRSNVAALVVALSLLATFAFAANAQAWSSSGDHGKGSEHVTICHATGSQSNPFVQISPSKAGVVNGHIGHQDARDIIPPFDYQGQHYSGQNWDTTGQAIWNNGCKLPPPPHNCVITHTCPHPPPENGTITLCKKLLPSDDTGRFNLAADSTVLVYNAGDGSCGSGQFTPGNHVVTETGANGTDLSKYVSQVSCVVKQKPYDPPGTSTTVTLPAGGSAVCTFTNTRKPAPPPMCAPGETGTPPHCMAPCPPGTYPGLNGTCVQVIVITGPPIIVVVQGPPTVVVVPCPCNCPKGHHGKHHPQKPPPPKCPKVSKAQVKAFFTPQHIKHGTLWGHLQLPKSWHVKSASLAICTPTSGMGKPLTCVSSKKMKMYVKKLTIKVKNGVGLVPLPLWKTGLWGHWLFGWHLMKFTVKLPCGITIVAKRWVFDHDPQTGVKPPGLEKPPV